MDRAQKQELVSQLHDVFKGAGVVVVTHYSGLSVKEMTELRNELRETGASFKVTKNRLTKLALDVPTRPRLAIFSPAPPRSDIPKTR
jgi:large subunit ribosomal protein L10